MPPMKHAKSLGRNSAGRLLLEGPAGYCCDGIKTILVRSRTGGFISQNRPTCNTSPRVRPEHIPDLDCEICKLEGFIQPDKNALDNNYYYQCERCRRRYKI